MKTYQGRTAVITGAGSGFGLEVARLAAARGMNLVLCDVQQDALDKAAAEFEGRVPVLVTDHGVLTETPALLAYVAHSFPGARLAPADAHGFARMQELHSYLASTVHVAHAHRPRASRWADEPDAIAAMQRKVPHNMAECFDFIERHYFAGTDVDPWVMGAQYTVADGYLFTIGTWLEGDGVDIARFPKVYAHAQRVRERPAVQRALA